MTVGEFVEKLKAFDQRLEVFVHDGTAGLSPPEISLRDIERYADGSVYLGDPRYMKTEKVLCLE